MKIGVITDIHSNIDALNAVLHEFTSLGIEKIICSGDIIGIGPRPEETVKRIMLLEDNIECVRGNHDNYLINGIPSTVPNDEMMDYGEIEYHKWEHGKLSEESIEFIKALPYTKTLKICEKTIYISHYAINEGNKYVNYTPNQSLDDLEIMFQNVEADIIVYGHNHAPSINHESNKWYLNTGSLGCPSDNINIARAGILVVNEDSIKYEELNVPYDVKKVIEDIQKIRYPDFKNILKYFYGIS
ncbi:metallophosphoesterase family protein [Clostridium folliculivorans]|uniref:metallophosphoesterase family protein n=1 Tax=Clostridium folliculivorans TaxID=2886038 RepID=UPI0021C42E45|nr:metallophosphoesterase family protein [Clostridium folliculivorans]GKU30561.1 metallophosphoesterase [Clostridium folliculivorans]